MILNILGDIYINLYDKTNLTERIFRMGMVESLV